MSRVKRLSIRGIRNFDDTIDSQIRFERPLTLIVGQNGVGKTTIIECLRYIATGEFPPNSDRGKSFIHDPMLKKVQSVKIRGLVKAEFTDCKGERFTVTRTMESTRLKDQIKFKSLDNAICKFNPRTKEEIMLTHRCVDMDLETINLLGVSKAIINYVIFCHQDDSNWPLDDGKKLKERFDEIFGTVNYQHALECIRTKVKDKLAEVKTINNEKKLLATRVSDVHEKQRQLNDLNDRKDAVSNSIKNMKSELKPKEERLVEILNIKAEHNELSVAKQKKNS